MIKHNPQPPISAHLKEEGWPFDPGTLLRWHDAHSRVRAGRYLRLDSDLLEENWTDDELRFDLISARDDEEGLDPADDLLARESETIDVAEQAALSQEWDRINYSRSYGVQIRISTGHKWPPENPDVAYINVPVNQVVQTSEPFGKEPPDPFARE
jgi:hypothetical protein